jgi:hypothetical protein
MTTVEQRREYQRRYRERHAEKRREDNRLRLAAYRAKHAHLSILEAVSNVDAFWSRVDVRQDHECWNWTGAKSDRGYGLYAPLPGVLLRTHRVAYALHNGSVDDDLFVCHTCNNPPCCNPKHLFLGTPKDNNHDMIQKGRNVVMYGESNHYAKLIADQVRSIYQDPRMNREIAEEYKVSSSLISMIRRRKIWAKETSNLPDSPLRRSGPKPAKAA